jgi:hypothetical protein
MLCLLINGHNPLFLLAMTIEARLLAANSGLAFADGEMAYKLHK